MSTIAPPRIVEVIATDAHEGPVYAADEDALYFTTVPRRSSHLDLTLPLVSVRRLALDGLRFPLEPQRLTTLRAPANAANGMTMDGDGRLVVCEQGSFLEPAAITRMDRRTGAIETVVDAAAGCRWRRRTTSSSRATARSGSPTPATASCRASGPSRRSPTSSTATTRPRAGSTSSPTASTSRTGSSSRPPGTCSTCPTTARRSSCSRSTWTGRG